MSELEPAEDIVEPTEMIAPDEREPIEKLGAAAAELLASLSVDNLSRGMTATVLVPRRLIDALYGEVEDAFPGLVAHLRNVRDGVA